MAKKLTNSDPLMESADKHSIYPQMRRLWQSDLDQEDASPTPNM